ncbi:MAG: DUF5676 family membrane protein [Xanthomonadales bacterium]|nr:DUF5676 family membrane protein [Xanthomonadales bacterium]
MKQSSTVITDLRITPLANALGGLFLISYVLCIGFGLLAPDSMRMWSAWAPLLPGFEWLTWSGFVIGGIESYAYGWYVAIVFVPLYRRFSKPDRVTTSKPSGSDGAGA